MFIKQLYTGCLAEAAYYIESEGKAAIIDPLRESEPYLELAKERNADIQYIFETHFHADFVSGHLDLAAKTGADIVFGPEAKCGYDMISATDGQEFELGKIRIRVLHTPGHTPESSTYLLLDENGREHCIFTGDTLFIGDVGRPDLAQKSGEITAEDMAATLFDSLRGKIMPLPDHVIVYPAHGAGSACGKNMSKETFDTLGHQKQSNYALGDISKEDFVKELTTGILPPPVYFAKAAAQNKQGYKSIDEVYASSVKALDVAAFEAAMNDGTLIIDTRHQNDFRDGHIKGSWFIGLHGQFAPWAGALIKDMHQPMLIIAESGKEKEAVMRLARVGYDNVLGYLDGAVQAWETAGKPLQRMPSITPEEFAANGAGDKKILDVRKPSEYEAGHLASATNLALDFFADQLDTLSMNEQYSVHCKSGYRSMIAASILAANGAKGVVDMIGGYDSISKLDVDKVIPVAV